MQKPTFLNSSTFIRAFALTTLAAATIFLLPAPAAQASSSPARQGSFGNDQQAPPSSAAQDSSASTPAKPVDKTTDAKAAPAKPDAKASTKKPTATSSAAKPTATMDSQANAPAKASSATGPTASHAPTASASHLPAASAPQSAGTPKKSAATKTGQRPGTKSAAALTLNTPKDKTSYAIGINVGKGLSQNLKQGGVDVDPAILTRAIKDVLSGDKQLMTDQEAQATLQALQAEMRKEQEEKAKVVADANKKEGDEFLSANQAKEGVITLPDGLQYKVLQEGTGPKPAASDSVTVNYRGTLLNGTEFDSSIKRGQPATFQVGQIIKGWTEALQLMPVGSKWQIFIPSDLAYGARGAGRDIGPNATLVFEVELLSIQPKPAAPAAAPAPAVAPAPHAAAPNPAPATNAAPAPAPKPTPPAPKPEAAPAPTPKPPAS